MLHEVKAQGAAEPLGGDEGLDPPEDLRLAGPVLVVNLYGAAWGWRNTGGFSRPSQSRYQSTHCPGICKFADYLLQYIASSGLHSCTFEDKTKHTWINSDTKYGVFLVILF